MVAGDRCRERIRAVFRLVLPVLVSTVPVTGAVAATFTVNNGSADVVDLNPGDGVCTTTTVGACTLRAAIMESNANPGVDTIELLSTTTFNLTRPGSDDTAVNGDLDVLDSVNIIGAGPASSRIDNVVGVLDDRILEVFTCPGNPPPPGPCAGTEIVVDISGVAFRNGEARGPGGSINNHGKLTLRNVSITDSRAINASGGAISSDRQLTIRDSTIRDNSAAGVTSGGGVGVFDSSATIIGSTISGNLAHNGGGLFLVNATTSLVNTTISGNVAVQNGGGVRISGGLLHLMNVTVAANRSNSGGSGNASARGGGVSNVSASVTLFNSILSANSRISEGTLIPVGDDCEGTFSSSGHNLVTAVIPAQCTINGIISGGGAGLGPLQDNGGPTLTHGIGVNSTGHNAGNPAGCINETGEALDTDQRGEPRPYGPACDLGAFELGDDVFRDGFES